MDLEILKHTMNNLVSDMSNLKKSRNVTHKTETPVRDPNESDFTSGTELDQTHEVDSDASLIDVVGDENLSIITPSNISRVAKNILKADLPSNQLQPLLSKTAKHLEKSSKFDSVPENSDKKTQKSVKSYRGNNESKLLRRRIANLSRALRIMKLSKEQLEEQLDILSDNLAAERTKIDQFGIGRVFWGFSGSDRS